MVNDSARTDYDVLVVGGGMVGLTASMFLAQQGVKTVVVEKHQSTSIHLKARNITIHAMEIFRQAGIEDEIRKYSYENPRIYVGHSLADEQSSLVELINLLDGTELSPIGRCECEQPILETIILKQSQEFGATTLFSHTVVDLVQKDGYVSVELTDAKGAKIDPITAKYVIVAEGAKGYFREKLGIAMHGSPVGSGVSVSFDADLESLNPLNASFLLTPETETVLFLKSEQREHHLLVALPRLTELGDVKNNPEILIKMIKDAVGVDDIDIKIQSIVPWESGAYIADKYRLGNIFLAGDSAHLNPPQGGYGANTGVVDAHNIAWKLAAVCQGYANDSLLDTYETERQPIAEYTVEKVLEIAKSNDVFDVSLGPTNVVLGFRYPVANVSDYDPNLPILDPEELCGEPGTRSPHIKLNGSINSTIDLIDIKQFTFLAPANSDYATQISNDPIAGITLKVIEENDVIDKKRWKKVFPTNNSGLLIRPDGVVAARFIDVYSDENLKQSIEHAYLKALNPDKTYV